MAANTAPIYSKVPKVGFGSVATANTAKDGTGTVVTVFTAGVEGGFVNSIVFRAKGTNVATVARVFLNNGSSNTTATNNSLIHEITLPATTNSETSQLAHQELILNRTIPAGYVINITIGTTVSAGYAVTCFGGDY